VADDSGERFASRAGEKLHAALAAFDLNVRGWVCADFGCNVGGFTDCLLQRGAAKVYAVDTGYGQLAWRLRQDARVVVKERTNALHCAVPERVDLVTIDVAWTPQARIVPAATRWLKRPAWPHGASGRIVSLLKPHYELAKMRRAKPTAPLPDAEADQVCLAVCEKLRELGCTVRAGMRSLLRGKGGNAEFVLLIDACGDGSLQDNGGKAC
jgi:23S rRNA (cytidine1920-2'-O)/16S rRNA (cytidine1409-2'-O)-methyltransferase